MLDAKWKREKENGENNLLIPKWSKSSGDVDRRKSIILQRHDAWLSWQMLDFRWRKLFMMKTEGANPPVQTLLLTAETLTAIILTNNASYKTNPDTGQKDIQDSIDPDFINECREPLYYGRNVITIASCDHTGSIHFTMSFPKRSPSLHFIPLLPARAYIAPSSAQASAEFSNPLVHAQVGDEAMPTEVGINHATAKRTSPSTSTISSHTSSDDDDKPAFLRPADLKE